MTALEFHAFVSDVASVIAQHVQQVQPAESAAGHDLGAPTVPSQLPVETYCLDHEKIVWHFPDVAARLIEEVR